MNSEEFFKSIQLQFKNKLPFVAYRKPNANDVFAIFQKDDTLCNTSNFSEKGFVFAPFDDKEDAVLIPSDISKIVSCDYVTFSKSDDFHYEYSKDEFEKQNHLNLVQKGIEAIKSGQFQKVVLSRNECVSLKGSNPITIFMSLLNTYSSAFVYCWFHPKVGLWLGATPETLLKVEGSRFTTMALAGTQKYDGKVDVYWDNKNKDEQQFVTDFVVDKVKDVVSDIKVSEVETIKAGSLLHLKSEISGSLNNSSNNLHLLINTLHPTPAVCGLPKELAKQFILNNENYGREFYTGFLGELNFETIIKPRLSNRNIENRAYASIKKKTQLFVNLRCMQLKNNDAVLYIGGGITKDSIPEKEWEETINKSVIMKRVL